MTALATPFNQTLHTPVFPYYPSTEHTRPAKFISLADIAAMCASGPTIGPKGNAAALTPFKAEGKKKEVAAQSDFYSLVSDHDHDDKSREQLQPIYDRFDVAYLGFTSSSHQQDKHGVIANRWKVLLPLSEPVPFERYTVLAQGLALMLKTDAVQTRTQQVFYAPNKISASAPFDCIDATDRPILDPYDDNHPLIAACLKAFEKETQRKETEAQKAAPKPRPVTLTATDGGIIDKVLATYPLPQILHTGAYKPIGKRLLSPYSESGTPGVMLFNRDGKQVCYSHHGDTDPLSNLNHEGHSLDVFDVLCALHYDGDVQRAVADLANKVDPDGQSQRQAEHMAQKERKAVAQELECIGDAMEQPETPNPGNDGIDLTNPPGLAGQICEYIRLKSRRPRTELYPFAALHLMALIGRKRKSLYTSKMNLITLAISGTAHGKESPQDAVKTLAREVGQSSYIHGNAGSHKDLIYNLLEGDGCSLYTIDEVHSFLDSMKGKNAQSYETKMEAEILTMSSTKLYTFRGLEKRACLQAVGKDIKALEERLDKTPADHPKRKMLERTLAKLDRQQNYLENGWPDPFFSLMGHSVPERMDTFIKPDNIASGMMGRTLIVRCPESREKLNRKPADDWAIMEAQTQVTQGLKTIQEGFKTINPAKDAAQYLESCVDWYEDDDQLNHYLLGGIYARGPEQLFKVATILALESGEISLAHAQYAQAMVRQSIKDVKHLLLKAYAAREGAGEREVMEHGRETVLRNCKGAGLTPSRLKQQIQRPKNWQDLEKADRSRDRVNELLTRMVDDGELVLKKDGRRERYITA